MDPTGRRYTFSGIVKLSSPSWVNGAALWHIVNNSLAWAGWPRDLAVVFPGSVLRGLTWMSLALETVFLSLALSKTRPFVWSALVGMHVGIIMSLVSFANLSMGMLMVHLLTFDPRRWAGMRTHFRSAVQLAKRAGEFLRRGAA